MGDPVSKFQIAVIMPVLNEERFIGQTLDQIYMQDFPMDAVEVVIADGGSSDRTREIAGGYKTRFGSLKILDNPRKLSSAGRNIGIRNTSAPYIIILDGHTYLPSKTLFKDMVAVFERTGADCLCRPQPLTPPGLTEFENTVAICRASALGHNPSSDIYSNYEGPTDPTSSGAMYRRDTFDRVGLFDEEFDACEDVDFNYRVNEGRLKAVISPKLQVCYYPRSTPAGLWRQMVRYGAGRFNFARKHSRVPPMQGLAAAGVVVVALLILLSIVSAVAWSLFRTLVGIYLLVDIGFSLYLAVKEKNLSCLLMGPLIFPVIHFGLGFGFLRGAWENLGAERNQPPRNIDLDI